MLPADPIWPSQARPAMWSGSDPAGRHRERLATIRSCDLRGGSCGEADSVVHSATEFNTFIRRFDSDPRHQLQVALCNELQIPEGASASDRVTTQRLLRYYSAITRDGGIAARLE